MTNSGVSSISHTLEYESYRTNRSVYKRTLILPHYFKLRAYIGVNPYIVVIYFKANSIETGIIFVVIIIGVH